MQMMIVGIAVVTLLVLPACILPTEFSEPGFYIGGSVTGAMENFDGTLSDDNETTAGVAVKAGGRILPWVSAELDYEYLDEWELTLSKIEMQTLTLQGKFNPLAGRFQPYGMVGLGYGWADPNIGSDKSDYLWRLGVGIDLYIIKMLAIFGEVAYTWPQGDLDKLEYATANVGVILKF